MKNLRHSLSALCLTTLVVLLGCSREERPSAQTPASNSLIAAHTSGRISCESPIRVHFRDDMVDSTRVGVALDKPPIAFKPPIKGTAIWSGPATLEFRPDRPLPAGKEYQVTVFLAKIAETVGGQSSFSFEFAVVEQSFEVRVQGLEAMRTDDLEWQRLAGEINTADVAHGIEVQKMLTVAQEGRDLPVTWTHDESRRRHTFVVDSIRRAEDATTLRLAWNGSPIGVNTKGEREETVPSISSFTVVQAAAIDQAEQYIEVRFSDPLDRKQNLRGLIGLARRNDLRYTIDGSVVRVYSGARWSGSVTVAVRPGIRNVMGHRLAAGADFTVDFEEMKPQIRFVGKGVIVPTTNGLTVPVEYVNLRAVIVEAVRIHADNVPQFLQVNELDGDREIKRVGRVVWKKVLQLGTAADRVNRWTRCGLDLSPLIRDNPHGIYRIQLSFARRHIIYECTDTAGTGGQTETVLGPGNLDEEDESSYWDYAEENEGYDGWGELYQNRNNPCHGGYYRRYYDHDIRVNRNILVSNIGLVAKQGAGHEVTVAVTDIRTARPIAGAELSLLDYQQQALATARSDGDGMASLTAERKPFVLLARYDGQSGYLKMEDGGALAMSHFDVAGAKIAEGLKGFLYGERGVWRPGDSLYLTFILNDTDNPLPDGHPIRFELRNARNQLVLSEVRRTSASRFHCFKIATDPDAPTGSWRARVQVGGAAFEKALKVETVMPNRLKIVFEAAGGAKYLTEGSADFALSGRWLHGAIARGLKADVAVSLARATTRFPRYEDYSFDDPTRDFSAEEETVYDGELDDNGERAFSATIQAGGVAPGMLTANFRTRLFEPGGAFSTDRFSLPYHPYDRYIGLRVPRGDKARGMLLTDTTHTVRIAAIGPDGNPAQNTRVEVTLYQIRWRWWWEKGEESLADYTGSSSHQPIGRDTVNVANGQATWGLRVAYPSWGRYLIRARDLRGDHASGAIVYIDWPGWAGRAQKDQPGGASVLTFSSDKSEYTVGEKVVLTIPSSPRSRGLVSIESGSKVLTTAWIQGTGEATRYEFTATASMSPNVYANVTLLQPHQSTQNDLPVRMYGVVPIRVLDPGTRLSPVIDAPEVFVPQEVATVKVGEASGRAMTYTLAVVDEGLLDLTRCATPDPWNHFYQREALGVKTWDLFDLVAGAYGGTLEQLLAVGGGDALDGAQKKANRFPPMVRFMGPFELARGARNTHRIDIPQYVGSARVMVVAGTARAYGSAEKAVFVRKPLMVLGTLPRVLGPEEETELPVAVFALEDKVKNVKVEVSTSGYLSLVGDTRRSLVFSSPGDEVVTFRLKAGAMAGIAGVSIRASGGGEKAEQNIELDIRMPVSPVVDVVTGYAENGSTWKQAVDFPGLPGTNEITLEVSRIPPLDLGRRLGFLIRYPYGCVEQTTSSVFPQLYLDKLLDLAPEKRKEVEKNVKAGIERLKSFQGSDGGFVYWPSNPEVNDWASNYAGHFLVEAGRAGYAVPAAMLSQWQRSQRTRSFSWTAGNDQSAMEQAYRLYTLALAGAPELGAMNRLRETRDLAATARWRLAAAYQLAGQPEAARDVSRGVSTTVKAYTELGGTYGSDLRDRAMILEALCLMDRMSDAKPIVEEISKTLASDTWMSTQTTAYALVALARHAGLSNAGGDMAFTYAWSDEGNKTVTSSSPIVQRTLDPGTGARATIAVVNTGAAPIYPRLILCGMPKPGSEKSASNGMGLKVVYVDADGGTIDPSQLAQGTDFAAEVTVSHTGVAGPYEEVALAHLVASGWEIRNERMDGAGPEGGAGFDYRDIRDDRVYTFFDLNRGASKKFTIKLHAAYKGSYYLPMIHVETMYSAAINARQAGKWVTVVGPEE